MISSCMAERYHQQFFRMVALPEGTAFRSVTEALCGLNLAGMAHGISP
jgi:dimethylglycine dehydrogenase